MVFRIWDYVVVIGVVLMVISCQETGENTTGSAVEGVNSPSDETTFQRMNSDETGIDFVNNLREDATGKHNIITFDYYYNGAGVAIGDINNDDKPDVFFASNEGKNRLYLNKGDLQFEDITEEAGINPANKKWSTGVVMADVNADGWLDIYVCQSGFELYPRKDRGNMLFINNGDNTFTEEAKKYGIDDRNESISAAFFDYDKDGDLDLYVLNESIYVRTNYEKILNALEDPENLENASGNLYENVGGKYEKVTRESGVLRYGFGLGVNVNDLNDDGWPDIYVSNDYSVPDFMFINNRDGTFSEKINSKTKQISYFGMGNDVADYNNDGLTDIMVADMAATDHVRGKTLMASMDISGFWYFVNERGYQYAYMFNTLQLNTGNGNFSNIAALAGVQKSEWSWAVLLADLDNDGWKDCYISNGFRRYSLDNDYKNYMKEVMKKNNGSIPLSKRDEVYSKMPEIKTENLVYKNERDLTFSEIGDQWNLSDSSYSNGAAYGDLDRDGDLDLVVNNIDHEAFVYKNMNRENEKSNYLQFSFEGSPSNPDGYNTKVTLHYDDQLQYQEFHPTRGYASSVGQNLHFGLGDVQRVDRVLVEWLDGRVQELKDVEANQRIELKIEDAVKKDIPDEKKPAYAFEEIKPGELGIDFKHTENEYDDFETEILMPHKQSTLGPKIAVGDVNGDELDDFYIGGAHGQMGAMYIQRADGTFQKPEKKPWEANISSEDMGAQFFDADGDDDLDLYVTSGGGGEMRGEEQAVLNDRLYINTQTKEHPRFAKIKGFDEMINSNNVVKSSDFDSDGDLDLFVGGAAEPGRYPFPERSYLLRNDGKFFSDVTEKYAPDLMEPGSVKDAVWTDIDGDGSEDLVVVGEWMPVMIMLNDGEGKLTNASSDYGTEKLKGWWYSVATADVNDDGREDLIAGNVGQNIKFSASQKKPFHVFGGDFDDNGQSDIFLSKKYKGNLVPTRGRECTSQQMPVIKEKFETYNEFAHAELGDILGENKLTDALHLKATTFASTVLINRGDTLQSRQLPNLAQIAPVNGILTHDFNEDGHTDLLIAGNMYNAEVETPRYDAGNGLILLGNGNGSFEPIPPHRSGFFAPLNAKDVAMLHAADGSKLVLVANNDTIPQVFKFARPDLISME